MSALETISGIFRGTRRSDPLIVTKCRLETWGRWSRDRTHLGLPSVSVYAKDTFIRSAVYAGEDEPPEISEVSAAVKLLTERRRLILSRYYISRWHIKQLAHAEGCSKQRMYLLFDVAVTSVERLLCAQGVVSGVTHGVETSTMRGVEKIA